MTIRTARPDDAAAVVAMANLIDVTSLATAASFRALLERPAPPATQRLVAEIEHAIVAWCPSGRHDTGQGWFWIGVADEVRRCGVGGELYALVEERLRGLGAPVLTTQVNDDDGRRFVAARGFERTNALRLQSLDLALVEDGGPAPGVVALDEVDGEALYELYAEAHSDVPTAVERRRISHAEYRSEVLEDELLDRELSVVLLEQGEPVAFTFVFSDRASGRAAARLTGVRRDRRARGLATAIKLESLRRARAAGLSTMLTANDLENAPMLAVNRRLGFRPSILIDEYEKALRPAAASDTSQTHV